MSVCFDFVLGVRKLREGDEHSSKIELAGKGEKRIERHGEELYHIERRERQGKGGVEIRIK
jgi:hypothetical protein